MRVKDKSRSLDSPTPQAIPSSTSPLATIAVNSATMAQSPTISIPKKSTDEVDWTTPIRNIIAQSYGESPDNYASECAALQRCRQDAVRGAGSDLTGQRSISWGLRELTCSVCSLLPLNEVLWTTRAARTAILRNPRLISLERRLYQQTHYPNLTRIREGLHHFPDCCNTLLYCQFTEPI